MKRLFFFRGLTAALLFLLARGSHASAPDAELLRKLAMNSTQLESIPTHTNFDVDGHLEELASDGTVKSTKHLRARFNTDGKKLHETITSYTEDGVDQTEKAKADALEHAKKPKTNKHPLTNPFNAGQQANYRFDQVEVDSNDPKRVRISFVPVAPSEDTLEGSAWVDLPSGTLLSAGFKLSKPPSLMDWVHITIEFGAPTSLGTMISKIAFEGEGGFLFFHKHLRGSANVANYTVVP